LLTIAGIGPGNPKYLTLEVLEAIKEAEYILAFPRVAKSLSPIRDDIIEVKKVDEILDYIKLRENTLLLASGDPNFFGIVDFIKREKIKVTKVLPGLSSFQYLMAKLNQPWQEANFISLHGRNKGLQSVKENRLSIVLIDKVNNPQFISDELQKLNIKGKMFVGFDLSYDNEKIIESNIGEAIEDYSSLGVVVIENEMD
jgi:cobalt-precorrin-7 (C5)-methyltransferase